MKKVYYKSKISTIALILLLTISATLVALPAATAQEIEYSKTTYAYIGAIPNPVGVNQELLLHVGIMDFLRVSHHSWENLTVTVTKPNGETETLGPYRTDATGGTGGLYIPNQVGTYTFQTHFPEQTYDWEGGVSRVPFTGLVLYEASDSEVLKVLVQEDPLEYYPGHSLPTEYWTRPVDAQLWERSSITGNWVTTPTYLFAPYNDYAPETAHILWTKPMEMGGLAGGDLGSHSMQDGDAYKGKFSSSVIIGGILFYNRFSSGFQGGMPQKGIVAIDLHTGEELWFRNNTRLSFGQTFYWDSYNYHGVFSYLWETSGSTWHAYDVANGEWIYTMENVPSGTTVYGPKGEIYRYTVDLENGWMSLWNSSSVVSWEGSWTPEGRTYDALRTYSDREGRFEDVGGIAWNVTIPTDLSGRVLRVVPGDRIIGGATTGGSSIGWDLDSMEMWAISLKPEEKGTLLWQEWWQPPPGDLSLSFRTVSVEDGIIVVWAKETRQHYGFSTETGDLVWGPTVIQDYLDIFGSRYVYADGKHFSIGMSGIVYCYDITTGKLLWDYEAPDEFHTVLWTNQWHIRPLFITDGKLYLGTSEHSPVDPKSRGAAFVCLDIENGDEVFRADGLFRSTRWGGRAIIGDSIIATMDTYDQRIYAIGKGPSATTVTAPDMGVPLGSSVMIGGTVMDISPGTEDYALTARFPNGVPAVSDADMTEWMLYVYKQFERPADATGVPVKLEAINPNGKYVDIGTAISDGSGNYGFTFEPDVEGKYMIMATFYGSEGYYGSTTTTYLTVDPAAEEGDLASLEGSVSNVEDSMSNLTTYIIAILALVIIALVIAVYSILKSSK